MNQGELHVAMITPWNRRGGIADYSQQLVSSLRGTGVRVTPVPIEHPGTPFPWRFNEIFDDVPSSADIAHVQFEAGLFGRFGTSGVCAPSFFNRLSSTSVPSITTLHEIHRTHSHRTRFGNRFLEWRDYFYERSAISSSEAVVVHTHEAREVLRNRHGESVDAVAFRYPVEEEPVSLPKDAAREHLELDDAGRLILTFGWVESKKRYGSVIETLPDLPDVTYVIAGEPRNREAKRYLERILEYAAELGVRDRVHVRGYVEDSDVPYLFNAVDMVVLPYDRISQSSVLNLALAYQCPTITPALPVFEEVVEAYDCLVTYDEEDSLTDVLHRTLTDQSLRKRLVLNAEAYAESETWESFAVETRSLYERIIDSSTRSS